MQAQNWNASTQIYTSKKKYDLPQQASAVSTTSRIEPRFPASVIPSVGVDLITYPSAAFESLLQASAVISNTLPVQAVSAPSSDDRNAVRNLAADDTTDRSQPEVANYTVGRKEMQRIVQDLNKPHDEAEKQLTENIV